MQAPVRVRPAVPGDAAELVRLRRLMFEAMRGCDEPGPWLRRAEEMVQARLCESEPRLGAFVVDGDPRDGGPRLAACAVGQVEERLPAPVSPLGRFGFVSNVCTDTRYRGLGYARATTKALLEWFAARGVTRVDLHATPQAERLYREFGFAEHATALSLHLTR